MTDLSGVWTLAAGRNPDPYGGRNEYDVRWVADRDWRLSRSFALDPGDGPWLLVADMLDTVAEVRVTPADRDAAAVILTARDLFASFSPTT